MQIAPIIPPLRSSLRITFKVSLVQYFLISRPEQANTRRQVCNNSGSPSAVTTTPFEASVGPPVGLEITQVNSSCPAIRLAARKGSIAEANASIEKLGISKNPTLRGPALLLACNRLLIFSSFIPAIMDEGLIKIFLYPMSFTAIYLSEQQKFH